MKLAWTNEALEKLYGIEDYISKNSPVRAVLFINDLIEHVDMLLPDNPRAGRVVPELADTDIRELIFRKYRIIYMVRGSMVEILTVFEGHRLLRIDDIGG